MSDPAPWVVLKFGGTSVSTAPRWQTIATQLRERLDEGLRPLVVCSALSGISNLLEALVRDAVEHRHEPLLREIEARHRALAADLGLDPEPLLRADLDELGRLALGASLVHEASPRLQARILAHGELLSTRLGAAFLAREGLSVGWLDARELLQSEHIPNRPEALRFLSATCGHEADPELSRRLHDTEGAVLLTQGFIARDRQGRTVLLGRGGSDTSAALLAARLGARRCEIWTDVPGMYTANPRQVPQARLLRALDYDEAQEIASMGAKVLHPRCIAPLRAHRIPLHLRCTDRPEAAGTVVAAEHTSHRPQVKCVSARSGLTLVSMDTMGMWQQVGFLADIFAVYARHGLSVDMVSTSETNVTVSLDPSANALDADAVAALLDELKAHCEARVIAPAAAVSLVGRHIRALLPRLGPALQAFEEHRVHLVGQAASDLNLTFVVDEEQSERLVRDLHALLFQDLGADPLFGPPLHAPRVEAPSVDPGAWWRRRQADLLALAERAPAYVYDLATVDEAARELAALRSIDRVLYAIKANPHPAILARVHAAGLGFECVSPGELDRVFEAVPDLSPEQVLFTPNFASRGEYAQALARGVRVTLDNLHPLLAWPELFDGHDLFVRVDPGQGRGHHKHVHTAGASSKFGVHPSELPALRQAVDRAGARVVGLHAHTGSGIRTPRNWSETALFLAEMAEAFPAVTVLDLGGGLGVPEKPGQRALDLAALDASLAPVRAAHPKMSLWLEPGRFLVARAGVLLARVTQLKQKGEVRYVGVETGMNSLLRPALYGAWHEIVNLSRLGEPIDQVANVVGPICESGDTLGHDRPLPRTEEGDLLLVATAGAYGHAMASRYNLREPAAEVLLP